MNATGITRILVIHGPNLNLLGEREPEIYGRDTLRAINSRLRKLALSRGVSLRIFQSNSEGEILDRIHAARKWAQGIVINPGAYTHYSYAIRDGIAAVALPCIEVHLSDLRRREKFRRRSVIAPVCVDQISGHGWKSYVLGIEALLKRSKSWRSGRIQ